MKHIYMLFVFLFAVVFGTNAYAVDVNAEALKTAIKNNNISAVKAFAAQGVDVNYRDNDGNTLLYTALLKNNLEAAKILIDAGADVNAPSAENGITPLIIATSKANKLQKDAEKIMARQQGSAVEAKLKKHIASQMTTARKMLQMLIDKGADVNQETPYGTPLMNAATNPWNIELIDILLKSEAQVNLRDRNGRTALFYGEIFGGNKIASKLLAAGADVDIKDVNGKTYMEATKEDFDEF